MLNFIKRLFEKKPSGPVILDYDLVGKVVEIKFHDPKKIGIVSSNRELTCTRFNASDLSGKREVTGIVVNVNEIIGMEPAFGKYIEVEAFSKAFGKRVFLFLQHEIESLRILK